MGDICKGLGASRDTGKIPALLSNLQTLGVSSNHHSPNLEKSGGGEASVHSYETVAIYSSQTGSKIIIAIKTEDKAFRLNPSYVFWIFMPVVSGKERFSLKESQRVI